MHLVATLRSSSHSSRANVQHCLAAISPGHQKMAAIGAGLAVASIVALTSPDPAFAQSANLEGFANNVLGLLSSGLLCRRDCRICVTQTCRSKPAYRKTESGGRYG